MVESVCQQHSGVQIEIDSIKDWQREHIEVAHKKIDDELISLRTRLPNWAVWAMTAMGSVIGFLGGMLVKGGT